MHGHPWKNQGRHSSYVIHGYSDKGVGSMCMAIREWTRDVTVTVIQGHSDKGVGSTCMCMAIREWTRDVTVTMSSRDILTKG